MNNNELMHWGVLGMKWGVRRYQNPDGSLTPKGKIRYNSTSLKSAIARRKNEKVDSSFKKWNENSKKKADAISLGKQANSSRQAYELDKSNKELKNKYKSDNKAYKKALRSNTTYRKGQIRQEVQKEASRNYLTRANRIKKQLLSDPNNKQLKKEYTRLMNQHDILRAKARKATSVAAKRSARKASIKRTMTMTAKAAVATAATAAGLYAVNKYLTNHDVRLNGRSVRIGTQTVSNLKDFIKAGKSFTEYIY